MKHLRKRMRHPRKQRRSKSPYRSGFEERVAAALKNAKVAFSYETLRLEYYRTSHYKPDFILPNGVILEVKGYFLPSDRTKHKLVKECHPELDIRFVFQNAHNTLSRKSKTTYAQWCDTHGFMWCHKEIPNTWMI